MDVIGDLVARDRRSEELAVRTDSRAGSYSYEKLCTNAWKAGNLLRHYGVRGGATVAVDAGESVSPPPLTAFFGAALLGAPVDFDPAADTDAKALVAPADRMDRYGPAPGTKALGYGDVPEAPEVVHYEEQLWSENPNSPPDIVAADATALYADEGPFTHDRLLSAAEGVVTEYSLDADATVALRAPLAEPGTVVAGVLAPVLAGATILVDRSQEGTVAVAVGDAPEPTVVDPAAVL